MMFNFLCLLLAAFTAKARTIEWDQIRGVNEIPNGTEKTLSDDIARLTDSIVTIATRELKADEGYDPNPYLVFLDLELVRYNEDEREWSPADTFRHIFAVIRSLDLHDLWRRDIAPHDVEKAQELLDYLSYQFRECLKCSPEELELEPHQIERMQELAEEFGHNCSQSNSGELFFSLDENDYYSNPDLTDFANCDYPENADDLDWNPEDGEEPMDFNSMFDGMSEEDLQKLFMSFTGGCTDGCCGGEDHHHEQPSPCNAGCCGSDQPEPDCGSECCPQPSPCGSGCCDDKPDREL